MTNEFFASPTSMVVKAGRSDMPNWEKITGNFAVHFMADCFRSLGKKGTKLGVFNKKMRTRNQYGLCSTICNVHDADIP